jgi:hypothetical protein
VVLSLDPTPDELEICISDDNNLLWLARTHWQVFEG